MQTKNQKEHEPKTAQTKNSTNIKGTNQNERKPKRAWTKKGTKQKEHKPKKARTKKSKNQKGQTHHFIATNQFYYLYLNKTENEFQT